MSPLLFNMFIDDIGNIFDEPCEPIHTIKKPLSHLLYADDLVLLSSSETGLNNCLAKLNLYCKKWHLEVNLKKSQIIVFNGAGKKLDNYSFMFGEVKMEIVKSYTYLGLELVASGSFWLAKDNLMDKARKAIFPLLSTISKFQLPCANSVKLFQSLIRPIVLYNSENWASCTFGQIKKINENPNNLLSLLTGSEPDKVFQKFIKFILGVNTSCTNAVTLGEIGEYPMMLHALSSLVTFWHRVSNMSEDTLVKQALNIQLQLGPEQSEWLGTVNLVMSTIGLNSHYQDPKLVGTKVFKELVNKRLKQYFVELWLAHISGAHLQQGESSKLRFYKQVKESFEREPYLKVIPIFHIRKIITKFRCSDHILEIEKGRHNKTKIEDRICKTCNQGIEDEMHFLKSCKTYSNLRDHYFCDKTKNIEWKKVIQCKDKDTSFKLGNFLIRAFKIREQLLEPLHI